MQTDTKDSNSKNLCSQKWPHFSDHDLAVRSNILSSLGTKFFIKNKKQKNSSVNRPGTHTGS